jgi:hypothetical protein
MLCPCRNQFLRDGTFRHMNLSSGGLANVEHAESTRFERFDLSLLIRLLGWNGTELLSLRTGFPDKSKLIRSLLSMATTRSTRSRQTIFAAARLVPRISSRAAYRLIFLRLQSTHLAR